MLQPREIEQLFANRLGAFGFYTVMKAAENADDIQAELLKRALAYDKLSDFSAHDARNALGHLATQASSFVEAGKLHKISLRGVGLWTDGFIDVIEPALGSDPEATLFLVANAPYIGFDKIAAASLRRGRALGILKPSRFGQTEKPVGFMMESSSSGVEVYPLGHDFIRPDHAIVFDDILATGTVHSQIDDFWGGSPPFITALRLASDGRQF